MALFETVTRGLFGAVDSAAPGARALTALDLARAERSDALFGDRDAAYAKYQRYYDGDQDDPRDIDFGTRQRTSVGGFRAAHNICAPFVDILTERLEVRGFTVSAGRHADTGADLSTEAADAYAAELTHWWQANRMDEHATTVHAQALVKGDSFVLVDYDAVRGLPRFSFHDALSVAVKYDAFHRIEVGFKRWEEDYVDDRGQQRIRRRITKYSPGLIEKYANEGRGWVLWQGDVDSEGQPDGGIVLWVDEAGAPLGVPIVHVRNKPRGDDYGRSELADVIPMQDEANRRIWYTSEAMSYQGSPQKYVINVAPPSGGFVSGPGGVWALTALRSDSPVTAGQFEAGPVGNMQDVSEREIRLAAGLAGVPVHLIWPEGALPSGESLKTAESRLVAKAKDRSVTFGNAWEDVMTLAVRLHNTFGAGGMAVPGRDVSLSTQWAGFETRSDLADENVIALRRDDLSWQEAMRERGFDGEQIAAIRAEKDEETPPALAALDQFPVQRMTAAMQQAEADQNA